MERHDAITRRPSLLAGGEEPTGARRSRERILPSIDTADAAARTARPSPRAWPWLLAVVLALAAVALLGPWPEGPGGRETLPPLAASGDRSAPPQASSAATIIDDAAATSGVGPSRAPAARADAPAPVDGLEGAGPGTTAASPFAAMAPAGNAPNPFGGSRPAALDRRERAAPAPPAEGAEALLATLLGHIQSTPGPETPMDRMVERLAREEATTTPAAATQASTPPVQFRSFQIQMNLRDCPPANTTEGVACRARICEVYAGRDPACPAG